MPLPILPMLGSALASPVMNALSEGAGLVMRPQLARMGRNAMKMVGLESMIPSDAPNADKFTQTTPASGTAPTTATRRGLSKDLREQFETDPRYAMALSSMKAGTDTSPAPGGFGEAVARALTGGIGGLAAARAKDEYLQRQGTRDSAIQQALASNDPDQMIKLLAGNPETADMATDIQSKRLEKQAEYAAKANEPISKGDLALKAGERIMAADGTYVPKYDMSVVNRMLGTPPAAGGGMPGSPASEFSAAPGMAGGPAGAPAGRDAALVEPNSPKAVMATQSAAGQNMADTAVPKPGENLVAKGMNSRKLIADAIKLNDIAYDGYVKGPATQMVGRVFGDSALSTEQRAARNAYTQQEQVLKALAAEAVKPLFGSAQLSDGDRIAAAQVASVLPTASREEKAVLLPQLDGIMQRKEEIQALEQAAAAQGQVFGPDQLRAYYASKGLEYDAAAAAGSEPSPTLQPVLPPPEVSPGSGQPGVVPQGAPAGRSELLPPPAAAGPQRRQGDRLPALKAKYGLQ